MRTRYFTLSSKDVQDHAAGILQHHLKLDDFSFKCTHEILWHVLLAAAGWVTSIHAVCQRLRLAPSDETVRQALLSTLPDYAELQRRVNRALAAELPKALRRRRQRLACDLKLIGYYGEPEADASELYRSKAKDGTCNFHAYATVYVVRRGQRFTVALTPVTKGEKMADVLKRLLGQARKAGVRAKLLLLDRGFYSVDVIRYLQCARVPFLMPAIGRGNKSRPGKPATGIRAFQLLKKGGWGKHTLTAANKRRATVRIAAYCGNYRGQWGRHGRFVWVYAFWGFEPGSLRWVADTYRLRFGIETSYRQLNEARIRTTTRKLILRFLFVAIALILRNVWVWYHWQVLSSPRRGERKLHLECLAFTKLLCWLVQIAQACLDPCQETLTERPT